MVEKIKETVRNNKFAVATAIGASASALPVVCHANEPTTNVQTSLSNAFTQVQNDALSYIQTALVPALVIMGTVLAITIGIKVFKRFTK